MQFSAGFLSCS